MLLDYGAEVNATFATLETTALMTSSFHGHSQIVRTLLDHGASAKAVDSQGSTALGYAFGGTASYIGYIHITRSVDCRRTVLQLRTKYKVREGCWG